MEMSFQTLAWAFPVAITLHNAEEALWLPGWSERAGLWKTPVSAGVFRWVATILTVFAFVVTGLSVGSGRQTVWTYLTFGYMVAMLANVLIPHAAASIMLRSYTPGLVTAVALNLPVLSLLVMLALKEGYVSGARAMAYSAGVTGLLLLSIPMMFKLGSGRQRNS